MNNRRAGAGPAGLALAYLLKRQDAAAPDPPRRAEPGRRHLRLRRGVLRPRVDFLREDDEATHALIVPAMHRWTD